MKVSDFDFSLPEKLIAERPCKDRTTSRLLVLQRDGTIEHRHFYDLPSYLDKGDILLINNTRVFPARLTGLKENGNKIEILLVREKESNVWEILSKGKFTGKVKFSGNMKAEINKGEIAYFNCSGDLMNIIREYGKMPLPPYIKRQPDEADRNGYQSIFAKKEGSIAAPTANLHFTDGLIKEISSSGVSVRELTLHVGVGTFKPIRNDYVEKHYMDAEYFEIDRELLIEIANAKSSGKKVISVGTTTTRAIEGYVSGRCSVSFFNGKIKGVTDTFIYPGYNFRVIDSLITNFHLPKSTPLMLTSALCGWDRLLKAYKEAIARRYRFLSYGDAMLIL